MYPTTIENYIGQDEAQKEFSLWVENINNSKKKICFITGLNGVGKSTFVRLMLKKYNYNIQEISSSSLRLSEGRENLCKSLKFKNILFLIEKKECKKAIIIDNFENMDINSKDVYKDIKTIFTKNKNISIPVIFIGERLFKNTRPLMANSVYIRLKPLNLKTIISIVKQVSNNTLDKKEIKKIANDSGGNLHTIYKYFEKKEDNIIKNKQVGPRYSLYRILVDNMSIDDINEEIAVQTNLLPYSLHLTLFDYIPYYAEKKNTTEIFNKVWDLYATYSYIDNYQRYTNTWEFNKIINTITCWGFNVILKEYKERKNRTNNKKYWWKDIDKNGDTSLEYGVYIKKNRGLLEKSSLTKTYIKKIRDASIQTKNFSILKNKLELEKMIVK
jgi:Holliday junction resolvasome RuvABC ATP-dependent DNA helicase subunit